MKEEIPWNRFAVEAIVIVVSILLAFALEATWVSAQQAEQEKQALDILAAELGENVNAIERRWLPNHVNVLVASADLLRRLHGVESEMVPYSAFPQSFAGIRDWYASEVILPLVANPGTVSDLTVKLSLIALVAGTHTYNPSIASLDLLIQAGELATLGDSELRTTLAELPVELADLSDEELKARNFFYSDVFPYLRSADGSMVVANLVSDSSASGEPVPDAISSLPVRLIVSPSLVEGLAKRIDLQFNVVTTITGMQNRFNRILQRIP
jgi:hypothetical protein